MRSTFARRRTVEAVEDVPANAVLSLDDFRSFMEYVNGRCKGIGCGYVRRDCRGNAMSEWLKKWSTGNAERARLVPTIRRVLTLQLPSYFRDYSRHDERIENEKAFVALHVRVVRSLSR